MKRFGLLTMMCLLACLGVWAVEVNSINYEVNTEEVISTYHPFVEAGKLWRVHGFNMGSAHRVTDYYFSDDDEAETIDGHTYLKMYAKTGEETTLVGLFREENQQVYLYKKDAGREFLTYDFSLQEGDSFSPEYGDYSLCEVKKVSYKEVNGEQLKVITFEANDRQFDADVRTQVEWIEGIGSSSWPLAGLYSGNLSSSWSYHTAYVLYDNTYNNNYYLPLTFGVPNAGWYGQQPQTVRQPSFEGGSKFQYELLPDPAHDCYQLHVYGDTVWSNSPNRYAYCVVEKSSSVYKVSIKYEELEPCIDGIGRYHVDLYFPFFLAEYHYVIVDKDGEHPVPIHETPLINTDYRPIIEEGKVWVTRVSSDLSTLRSYTIAGDTIIWSLQCKKVMCKEWFYTDDPTSVEASYAGALYEDNLRTYFFKPGSNTGYLLYDFNPSVDEEVLLDDGTGYKAAYTVVQKAYSETECFKGLCIQLKASAPPALISIWMEGVGNSSSPLINILGECATGREWLLSCTINDEVLYYDPSKIEGVTLDVGGHVKKNWLDFTHTVKTKPKAPSVNGKWTARPNGTLDPSRMDNGALGPVRRSATLDPSRTGRLTPQECSAVSKEETVTGEYSVKELFVNFKTLAGPYTITVTDAAGQPIYNKVVQTSNVVALNTDISTYPKGSYTITVENEEEMYTAEFNIKDEDSLTPNPSPVGEGNYVGEGEAGAAYDLSGRRIVNHKSETLPLGGVGGGFSKGIYIIDGRKVVIH